MGFFFFTENPIRKLKKIINVKLVTLSSKLVQNQWKYKTDFLKFECPNLLGQENATLWPSNFVCQKVFAWFNAPNLVSFFFFYLFKAFGKKILFPLDE